MGKKGTKENLWKKKVEKTQKTKKLEAFILKIDQINRFFFSHFFCFLINLTYNYKKHK